MTTLEEEVRERLPDFEMTVTELEPMEAWLKARAETLTLRLAIAVDRFATGRGDGVAFYFEAEAIEREAREIMVEHERLWKLHHPKWMDRVRRRIWWLFHKPRRIVTFGVRKE